MKCEDRTCLSYWFPLIRDAGLPVPETQVLKTDCELIALTDGDTPTGWDDFLASARTAAHQIGYPLFLRTGHTSHKHDWKETCYVEREDDLGQHIYNLVEFSACCDCFGLPDNVWVFRKLIPTAPAFVAFNGMPIVREFRVFTKDYQAVCIHPYWPADVIQNPSVENWRKRLDSMSAIGVGTDNTLKAMAVVAAEATDHGDWSVDFLQDAEGKWWLTDMAEADRSWHWPGCAKQELP